MLKNQSPHTAHSSILPMKDWEGLVWRGLYPDSEQEQSVCVAWLIWFNLTKCPRYWRIPDRLSITRADQFNNDVELTKQKTPGRGWIFILKTFMIFFARIHQCHLIIEPFLTLFARSLNCSARLLWGLRSCLTDISHLQRADWLLLMSGPLRLLHAEQRSIKEIDLFSAEKYKNLNQRVQLKSLVSLFFMSS